MNEKKNIKICVSSVGEDFDSEIDPRFGRCEYFLIVEVNDGKITKTESVKNVGVNQNTGAGIGAAEQVGKLNVDVVITGDVGPKAKDILGKLDIEICKKSGVVSAAVNEYLNNGIVDSGEKISSSEGDKENMDNQRIFIPLMDDNSELSVISLHFGHAPFFGLYNVGLKELTIAENKLDHSDVNTTPVDQIIKQVDPTIVFAQDMGARAVNLFNEKNISLKTGPYKTVKEVIDNINNLEALTTSCDH